jgi:hypothetical protein
MFYKKGKKEFLKNNKNSKDENVAGYVWSIMLYVCNGKAS